jgi:adenylate kinase
MRIVLLGPPGAGKGTQAKLLEEALSVPHVSTGDIFRQEMNKNTPLGKDIKAYVRLVPDDVVTKIIESRLGADKELQKGFLLDGFPRTRRQAEDLDAILETFKIPLDYVLYMDATLPVIIRRLTGRRVCRSCGALYHMINRPPRQSGRCDQCGSELYQRPDDNEETIRKRMEVYQTNTAPIIEYYTAKKTLYRLDADKDSPVLQTELMAMFRDDGKFD